jgi:hypothetical protein
MPQPNGIREQHIVGLMEVKMPGVTEADADEQMMRYMNAVAELPNCDRNLKGYIVSGQQVLTYWLEVEDGLVSVRTDHVWFDMFAPGDRLTQELCQIAVQHWN